MHRDSASHLRAAPATPFLQDPLSFLFCYKNSIVMGKEKKQQAAQAEEGAEGADAGYDAKVKFCSKVRQKAQPAFLSS